MVRRLALAALLAAGIWIQGAGAVAPANLAADSDEREIRLVFSQLGEAWNRHDASAWAAFFAEDADFTSSLGATTHGRGAITALQATLFRGALAESALKTTVIDVRFLDKETAVVRSSSALDGVGFATTFGPANGTYRSLAVVHKESGRWNIAAMQCVRVGNP
ncbi:MAG TPA: SgcJ/EcaC family oxidoreductase [Usitatibacter sp.]|nr:SgcJ/EcaC family oxidoreductase [Usitatibacter sp.]